MKPLQDILVAIGCLALVAVVWMPVIIKWHREATANRKALMQVRILGYLESHGPPWVAVAAPGAPLRMARRLEIPALWRAVVAGELVPAVVILAPPGWVAPADWGLDEHLKAKGSPHVEQGGNTP